MFSIFKNIKMYCCHFNFFFFILIAYFLAFVVILCYCSHLDFIVNFLELFLVFGQEIEVQFKFSIN